MGDINFASLMLGLALGASSALAGVVVGYEIGRAARMGRGLFALPKFKRSTPDTAKGRQYTL
ncbi:hypothetical protein N9878_01175 [bacterium]|nr:hypothetical protein [bacterium]